MTSQKWTFLLKTASWKFTVENSYFPDYPSKFEYSFFNQKTSFDNGNCTTHGCPVRTFEVDPDEDRVRKFQQRRRLDLGRAVLLLVDVWNAIDVVDNVDSDVKQKNGKQKFLKLKALVKFSRQWEKKPN